MEKTAFAETSLTVEQFYNLGLFCKSTQEGVDQPLCFIVEAQNAAAKQKSHITSNICYEAVEVIDDVLFFLDI